jgi:hypothetical protein
MRICEILFLEEIIIMFNKRRLILSIVLFTALLLLAGCAVLGFSKDPLLAANPYQKLAFYGKVIDKETKERPIYPPKITLEPENPGNILVVDSSIFYIEDKGLDPAFEYTLKVSAVVGYSQKDTVIKYIPGKRQFLGVFVIECLEKPIGAVTMKPFVEFTPGTGIVENKGWKVSSFIDYWKTSYSDQPFKIEDIELYIKNNLPSGSPVFSRDELNQAINLWIKDGLVEKYGRNAYKLK